MSGLFDFVKTVGKKIFGEGEADPAAKIKAEIEKGQSRYQGPRRNV